MNKQPLTLEEATAQYDALPANTYDLVTTFHHHNGCHRDKQMLAVVTPSCSTYKIDEMPCAILALVDEPGWLIVANRYNDDARFTDIGPFDTLNDAITYTLLRKDSTDNP